MPKILLVCTANICRSPVAEVVLRDLLARDGRDDWTVRSAGTWAEAGNPAASHSIDLLRERGLDLTGHRSQMVNARLLASADLILCMARGHAEALRVEFPQYAPKIFLLSEMIGRRYDIDDPFGGPRAGYERMVRDVTSLLEQGLPRIKELAQTNAEGIDGQ